MCGGKYNTGFIAIFLRCITAKNYANQPRIDKVIAKIKRVQFFETQCRCDEHLWITASFRQMVKSHPSLCGDASLSVLLSLFLTDDRLRCGPLKIEEC